MLQTINFFPLSKASEVITLKANLFSPDCLYKHVAHVLENYSQLRDKLCVLLSETSYTESLERPFSSQYLCPIFFNFYVITEGFKI